VSASGVFPGARALAFDLSGIALHLEGVPAASAATLCRDWAAFRIDETERPFLHVEISRVEQAHADPAPFDPKSMRAELGRSRATFRMPQGRLELDGSGRARLALASGLGAHEYFTLLNLLRAALAASLPSRGGALVHAAALVVDGRAFALAGAEGSGKSTWAREGEHGGANIVSDDLILVDREGEAFVVAGAPFRSTHRVDFRRGRWPLAAILFPRHGARPGLAPVPPLLAQARIVANLPFVAEALDRDERLRAVVERLVERVPCRELTFAPDPGFIGLLRAFESAR